MECNWKTEIESIKQEDDDFTEIHVTIPKDIDFASLHTVLEQINNDPNQNYEDQHLNFSISEIKQECSRTIKVENNDDWSVPKVPDEEYQLSRVWSDEKVPFCMLCGKYFSNRFLLYEHNLCHLKVQLKVQKVFRCDHCLRYFQNKQEIKYHMAKQHYWLFVYREETAKITKLTHKCLLCDKKMPYKAWFSHMDEVHGAKRFKCQKCNKLFKGKRFLIRHNQFVHEGLKRERKLKEKLKIKCPKCPGMLDTNYALTTHLRNCHSIQKFECHLCKSVLKCKAYLNTHMIRVHRNEGKMHKCKHCIKEFKSARYLRIHVKNLHKLV